MELQLDVILLQNQMLLLLKRLLILEHLLPELILCGAHLGLEVLLEEHELFKGEFHVVFEFGFQIFLQLVDFLFVYGILLVIDLLKGLMVLRCPLLPALQLAKDHLRFGIPQRYLLGHSNGHEVIETLLVLLMGGAVVFEFHGGVLTGAEVHYVHEVINLGARLARGLLRCTLAISCCKGINLSQYLIEDHTVTRSHQAIIQLSHSLDMGGVMFRLSTK